MDNFPIPKTPAGVVSSLILSVVLLALYYLFAFSYFLLPSYDNQFYTPVLYEEKSQSNCAQVVTYVKMPKFVYANGRQWVYVSFYNDSDIEVRDVRARFVLLEKYSDDKPAEDALGINNESDERNMMFLLPSFFSENLTDDHIHIEVMLPHTKIYGRFNFPTRTSVSINNTRLMVSCVTESHSGKPNVSYSEKKPSLTSSSEESNIDAFLHAALENILLPPWANAVIPAFAVLASWLFEQEQIKRQTPNLLSSTPAGLFLSDLCRIVFLGLVFNLALGAVFIVFVKCKWVFIAALLLLLICSLLYVIYTFLPVFKSWKKSLLQKRVKEAHSENGEYAGRAGEKTKKKRSEEDAESIDKNMIISDSAKDSLQLTPAVQGKAAEDKSMEDKAVESKAVEGKPAEDKTSLDALSNTQKKYWCRHCGKFYETVKPEKCEDCGNDTFDDFPPVLSLER